MPVVDLADYLGMPAQAPQQPMFQTTQRMAPALSQADLIRQNTAAFETLGNLQRLAPAVQAQQAQLAYDTVAQQARDLRMKQEIEAQAERAVNEMIGAGVTPESADYSTRMRDLVTRNPLALRDPGFQQIAALYEDQSRSFQQAREAEMASEAAYQKALNEDILRATEAGVDPRLLQGVQDRQMVAYLKSQLPRGGRTGIDPEERRLRNQADVAQKRFDALSKSLTASEEQIADAERSYLAALDNLSQYDPSAVVQQQATTQTVRPPMAAAANAGGQVVVPAPQIQQDAPPPPVLPEIPLTVFEQEQKQRAEARQAEELQRQQSAMDAWTAAKNQAMTQAASMQALDPTRLINMAKSAVVGGPIEANEQEKQIVNRIAGYARAAVEGRNFDVATPVKAPSGKTEMVRSKASPGWAFLRDLNLNPYEVIEIPGQGIFGTTKTMYAGDLMDLRLKEIGQPLVDTRAAQEQSARAQKIQSEAQAFRGK